MDKNHVYNNKTNVASLNTPFVQNENCSSITLKYSPDYFKEREKITPTSQITTDLSSVYRGVLFSFLFAELIRTSNELNAFNTVLSLQGGFKSLTYSFFHLYISDNVFTVTLFPKIITKQYSKPTQHV